MDCCFSVFTYKLKSDPVAPAMDYIYFKLQGNLRIHEVNCEFTAAALGKLHGTLTVQQGPQEGNIQELSQTFFTAAEYFSFGGKGNTLKIASFTHGFKHIVGWWAVKESNL